MIKKYTTGNLSVTSEYYHRTRKGRVLFLVSLVIDGDKKVIGASPCRFSEIVKSLKEQKNSINSHIDFAIPVSKQFYNIYRHWNNQKG